MQEIFSDLLVLKNALSETKAETDIVPPPPKNHLWSLWALLGTFGHYGHFWALWAFLALWAFVGTMNGVPRVPKSA